MNTFTKKNKFISPVKKTVKTKTVKSRTPSRNNAIKETYIRNYYGKDTLPETNIIQYINTNFNDYMVMKEEKTKAGLKSSSFKDFFVVDDVLKKSETKFDVDIQINKLPNVSLEKLLAYSLYYNEYKNWFKSPNKKMDTGLLKYQSGKDLSRLDITINNKKYNSNPDDDKNKITDDFNVEVMNILSKFTVIDFDLINKLDIALCQNMYNFITDLISILIADKLEPEIVHIFKPEKDVIINLTKSQQNIIYNFKTRFFITKDGGIVNPEYTCGYFELIFLLDFKKNTYKILKLKCNYDTDICYQEELESLPANVPDEVVNEVVDEAAEKDTSKYFTYGIPIALGVGGIVATPFLLGALGGKNKKIKNKKGKNKNKNKTKKRKKSFYK
jgi:hypothetical protein